MTMKWRHRVSSQRYTQKSYQFYWRYILARIMDFRYRRDERDQARVLSSIDSALGQHFLTDDSLHNMIILEELGYLLRVRRTPTQESQRSCTGRESPHTAERHSKDVSAITGPSIARIKKRRGKRSQVFA